MLKWSSSLREINAMSPVSLEFQVRAYLDFTKGYDSDCRGSFLQKNEQHGKVVSKR